MGSHRELLEQASLLYLDNIDECIRHRADINVIFNPNSGDRSTKELYEWTCSTLLNSENVSATNASGILFVCLVSISHFTQKSMYIHWKEASGLKNINLFGLIVGLSGECVRNFWLLYEQLLGSDKSGLINIIQSCYRTCECLFPDFYVADGKNPLYTTLQVLVCTKNFLMDLNSC